MEVLMSQECQKKRVNRLNRRSIFWLLSAVLSLLCSGLLIIMIGSFKKCHEGNVKILKQG
jgi:hypothetical protein